jgi:lipopolysaccharide biosynthesis regulator YciM
MDVEYGWGLLPLTVLAFVSFNFAVLYLRRFFGLDRASGLAKRLNSDYFKGLQFILNEQPDKAVDVFIQMLSVDDETVETHLALGTLFRRRGEVDRALRIHQNLIARPHLDVQQRLFAMLELGRDYWCAGFLDRAEDVFKSLAGTRSPQQVPALKALLEIYQQQQDWESAIDMAQRLQRFAAEPLHSVVSHYYCELAKQAELAGEQGLMGTYLRRSLQSDPNSVRANLMYAEYLYLGGDNTGALKIYQTLSHCDPRYLNIIVLPLLSCYGAQGDQKDFYSYIHSLIDRNPAILGFPIVLEALSSELSRQELIAYLMPYVDKTPSLQVLYVFMKLLLSRVNVASTARESLDDFNMLMEARDPEDKGEVHLHQGLGVLYTALGRLLEAQPSYHCQQCGFSVSQLLWFCPGCKQWGTILHDDFRTV